ncbi:MAG TPA: hypothetical protein VFP34_15640, partial [Microlunatus sp.]|nr:hypothetical protein [Microlunatus sp.]
MILTTAAFALVALVVVIASLVAHRADQQPVSAPSRSAAPPRITTATDSIEFTTRTGSGRLTIVEHAWRPGRTDPGSVLEVDVRIECTSGSVGYDPFAFQAFDGAGNLFDLAAEEIRGPMLGVGVLRPGETTTGQIAF